MLKTKYFEKIQVIEGITSNFFAKNKSISIGHLPATSTPGSITPIECMMKLNELKGMLKAVER